MQQKNEFIELRAQGLSYQKISDTLNISKPVLIDWGQEFQNQILNLKTIDQEYLQQKYLKTKEQQLKNFSELLERLNQELESRDLKDLSTKDLLQQVLIVSDKLESQRKKLKVIVEVDYLNNISNMMSYDTKNLI